jgi:hypothetical protein
VFTYHKFDLSGFENMGPIFPTITLSSPFLLSTKFFISLPLFVFSHCFSLTNSSTFYLSPPPYSSAPPFSSPLFPKLFLFSLHFPLFILFSILLSPFFPFLPPIILSFLLFHNIPLSHHIFRVKTLVFMWDIIFHTGMECNKCVYF